ncbi:response regulator [Synechococcales cyanobacterium C]|uniref:Response regulator n=1 Tax=Petrachloros mirabilis ULC683 TaxID=2781853 RepID=A0A8K2A2N4_9CYAN|nr:response regulator transcription factor [Petrachloros mirabilis]NCJ08711.1 response regulator [Petrachloros mirabilis ULC683]
MIRVLLVDDQNVIRQGLQVLLNAETDIEIVALGQNGEEAIELVEAHRPDVVLMDVYMPIMDGVTATSIICQDYPGTKILLLSGSENDNRTLKAIAAGAKGYLLKSASSEELANSIRAVYKGYTQLAPGILESLMAQSKAQATPNVSTPPASNIGSARGSPPPHPAAVELKRLLALTPPIALEVFEPLIAQANQKSIAQQLSTQIQQVQLTQGARWDLAYLAGQLCAQGLQQPAQALKFFKSGLQQAQAEGAELTTLLHFCRAMKPVQPKESYNSLKQLFANYSQQPSCGGFLQAVAQMFGSGSPEHRWVGVLWQMQAIHLLSQQCQTLKSKLDDINQKIALSLDLKKHVDSEDSPLE